jgi:hypothetical protein
VAELEAEVKELTQVMELRQIVQQLQAEKLGTKKNSRSCIPSSNKPPPPRPPLF